MDRYTIRFTNGVWIAFDAHSFKPVERFRTYAEGVRAFVQMGYLPAAALAALR